MKAKRRQELKTNDLAHALEELGQNLRDWGVYILGGVVVIVAVFFISAYTRNARTGAIATDFAALQSTSSTVPATGERKVDLEIMTDLDKLNEVANSGRTPMLRRYALERRGMIALRAAESGEDGIDAQFLDVARDSFDRIVTEHASQRFSFGRALYGLFQVEADAFAVDQDSAHKSTATGYLEQLRDDSRFNGTPFQTRAVDMLNNLDEVFTVIKFAKRPEDARRPPNAFGPSIGSMIQLPKPDANQSRPQVPIQVPVNLGDPPASALDPDAANDDAAAIPEAPDEAAADGDAVDDATKPAADEPGQP